MTWKLLPAYWSLWVESINPRVNMSEPRWCFDILIFSSVVSANNLWNIASNRTVISPGALVLYLRNSFRNWILTVVHTNKNGASKKYINYELSRILVLISHALLLMTSTARILFVGEGELLEGPGVTQYMTALRDIFFQYCHGTQAVIFTNYIYFLLPGTMGAIGKSRDFSN